MSFANAIQNTNREALGEFSLASMEYKQACSRYTIVRRATVDLPDATDSQIVAHHKAHEMFKQACRKYTAARTKWLLSVRAASMLTHSASNEELYAVTMETNDRAITEQFRKESLLASVTPEELEIGRKLMEAREAKNKDRNVLVDENDPTLGDFEPL